MLAAKLRLGQENAPLSLKPLPSRVTMLPGRRRPDGSIPVSPG